jgi:2-phosphosulfolactate phosphatase
LYIEFLASAMTNEMVQGRTAVVVDVLRATTTISQALGAGAAAVAPCRTVEQARELAARFDAGTAVLGGERGGRRIDGFDLGNSPAEYTPERVGGRTVVFTTTNGTAAMGRCSLASRIFLGTFVNLAALAERLENTPGDVVIVCAGTQGEITREDVLFAGALAQRLTTGRGPCRLGNDPAAIARDAWNNLAVDVEPAALLRALRDSQGGRNLAEIGLAADIDWAARPNAVPVVPELVAGTDRIISAGMG